MALFGGSKNLTPVAEPEPPKSVYEVEEIYGPEDREMHLVLAYDREDAIIRHLKTKKKDPNRLVLGIKAAKCEQFKSITLGTRKYI